MNITKQSYTEKKQVIARGEEEIGDGDRYKLQQQNKLVTGMKCTAWAIQSIIMQYLCMLTDHLLDLSW